MITPAETRFEPEPFGAILILWIGSRCLAPRGLA